MVLKQAILLLILEPPLAPGVRRAPTCFSGQLALDPGPHLAAGAHGLQTGPFALDLGAH